MKSRKMDLKMTAIVLVLLVSAPAALMAQTTTTTGWMSYHDTLGRTLDLTSEQEDRIREWNDRYEQEFERLGPDGVRHRDHAALRQRRSRELQGILSPEQFREWDRIDNDITRRSTNTTGGAPGPEMRRGVPVGTDRGTMDRGDGRGAGTEHNTGTSGGSNTGNAVDRGRGVGTDGGTGTTGTGSATDGGNRNTVTPPTP